MGSPRFSVLEMQQSLRGPLQTAPMKAPPPSSSSSSSSSSSPATTALASFFAMSQLRRFAPKRPKRFLSITAVMLMVLALGLCFSLQQQRDLYELEGGDVEPGPVVDLGYTKYRGSYLDNGVSEFLQMRFAQAPTGDLRWRAPVEPLRTKGITSAKEFGPICLGVGEDISDEIDEDCLFVNVWTPSNATKGAKLPVMVFIQGGGYTKNANANWNGSDLVETSGQNIVFVNFNYRVGLWGFLAGKEVEHSGHINAGLLDQRFLLHWVQKHIVQFGGDPNHVVVQGVSAGGGSVALHLAAYGGRNDNLFIGAISESTFIPQHPSCSDLEYQLERVMNEAGCFDARDRMECLRSKTKEELQSINHSDPFPGQVDEPRFYFTPCIDGHFLRESPYSMFESGSFVKVPVLFGSCTDEGSGFTPDAKSDQEMLSFLNANYPSLTTVQHSRILQLYPLEPPLLSRTAWYPSASRAYGDVTFTCPTDNLLNAFITAQKTGNTPNDALDVAPIWAYRYDVWDDVHVANGRGVPHVFETAAVFGPRMLPAKDAAASYFTYNLPMVSLMMKYWISFARALDPNVHREAGAPVWETWGTGQQRIVFRLGNTTMESPGEDEWKRCRFWQSNANVTQQ